MTSSDTEQTGPAIFAPPFDLKKRAPEVSGESFEELIAKADAAVAELADEYPSRVEHELEDLSALVSETIAAAPTPQPERMRKIYDIAHDFKGHGGSFGYDLISRIGASLCRLTQHRDGIVEAEAALIQAHSDALRAILTNDIKGDGGALGGEMAGGLEKAVTRYADEDAE